MRIDVESPAELTLDTDQLTRLIGNDGRLAFQIFRAIPLCDIRRMCLQRMERAEWLNTESVTNVESDIRYMIARNDELWPELLAVYASGAYGVTDLLERAIQFIIGVCPRKNLRSKLVRGFLAYHEERYPLVRVFMHLEVADFVTLCAESTRQAYGDEEWYRLTRALGVITHHKDYGVLAHVRRIADALANRNMRPSFVVTGDRDQRFLLVQHRAYIREVIRQLSLASASSMAQKVGYRQ